MSKKNILTLEDLYNFYSSTSKRSRHFSSEDENKNIVVQVPGNIVFEQDDNALEGLTKVTLHANHTGTNLNGSNINDDVAERALASFANRPILGYIHMVDGQYEFYDHRMHMEDGELVYDEKPVGTVPESSNAHLEYDEEKQKTYVVVNGYLYDEYSPASEILKREGECACSVELGIRELSFDAKKKVLNIEDYYYNGVTILGKTPEGEEVRPGMSGANIKLSDFTQKSVYSQDNMIAMLEEINNKLNQLTIDNLRKEENQMSFDENATVIESPEEEGAFEEEVVSETETQEAEAEQSTEEVTEIEDNQQESEDVTPSEDIKFSKQFEISHEDIRCALYALLTSFEEEDNEWYYITSVYDDSFIYEGMCNADNKYKQHYIKDGDNIAFDGERIHVNVEYLTDNELTALNAMRSNYEEISEKLAKYEAEPEKVAILESEDYAQIRETEEYSNLAKRETYFELDKEELSSKLDEILLNYAKQNKLEFAAKTEDSQNVTMKRILTIEPKNTKGRYGRIFSKN